MNKQNITDTERLDWLIKQGPPSTETIVCLSDETWELATMHASDMGIETDDKAIRDTIDAAMREGGK